jgi:enolase
MDSAASEFYKDGKYDLDFKNPKSNPADYLPGTKLAELYKSFSEKYPSKLTCNRMMSMILLIPFSL